MTLSWGSAISRGHIHAQVKKALRNTGVRKFVFHNLRNTALTEWARRQGIPVDAAMKASGHSSVQIHKRYVDSAADIANPFGPSQIGGQIGKQIDKSKRLTRIARHK
jgi:integrase